MSKHELPKVRRLLIASAMWIFVLVGCDSNPVQQTVPQAGREPTESNESEMAGLGAIVCAHVAAGEPILLARRSEPIDPDDSGWQFLCNSGADEKIEDANIWKITQVTESDPSILKFVDAPVGTILSRKNQHSEWALEE